jgi:AT hook motif
MIKLPAGIDPCPRFGDDAPLADPVNERPAPNKRTPVRIINEQEARINEQALKADKLAAARAVLADIGSPAVEPRPLVDTTKVKGRGRPKKWASDAERMASKRSHERERKTAPGDKANQP